MKFLRDKSKMFALMVGFMLLVASLAVAQAPKQNVSGARHPNLAAAQKACENAYAKISAAQQANEFDMAGHAAKAKELLNQANTELKAAAQAANKNGK
jgi:F0F1-type ATP synthase membrane subunit b/b'